MSPPYRIPGTRTDRTLLVLPTIPDDFGEHAKNAIAIRNSASTTGACPDCGAVAELYPDPEHDGFYHGVFRHESQCKALSDDETA